MEVTRPVPVRRRRLKDDGADNELAAMGAVHISSAVSAARRMCIFSEAQEAVQSSRISNILSLRQKNQP